MGMTIGINSTEYFGMTSFIQSIEDDPNTPLPEGRSAAFFIENILPEFGKREGTQFMVLNCEYWDEYNPYYQLLTAMELYFGIQDVWYDDWEYLDSGANALEVLEELDVEPIDYSKKVVDEARYLDNRSELQYGFNKATAEADFIARGGFFPDGTTKDKDRK